MRRKSRRCGQEEHFSKSSLCSKKKTVSTKRDKDTPLPLDVEDRNIVSKAEREAEEEHFLQSRSSVVWKNLLSDWDAM